MRRVVVGAMVSVDGVMQAPGGPDEDPTGGFKFGGWVAPLADVDPVFGAEIGKLFGQPFDLLLGRRTYDIFAAYWPFAEGGAYDDIATAFNRVTKYVATRKGADLTWKGSVALRDAAKDVAKLKQEDGPTLVTQGSSELVHSLLAADLVDEIRTFTFPLVLGKGKRLFDERSRPRAFTVTHSAVSANGIIAATYARDGEVKTATVGGAQEPSGAELARREKLRHAFIERVHGIRYQVKDVARAVAFYTQHLGFTLEHQQLPAFASVSLGDAQILLSGPGASGSRPMPNGEPQQPGGWNRVVLRVSDLAGLIARLERSGLRFRNEMETGPGGKQIQIEDPDGNPVELFEPAR